MLLWFTGFQILDVLTTYIGISYFGGIELIPFTAWCISAFGLLPSLMLMKMPLCFALYFGFGAIRPRFKRDVTLVSAAIVGWNFFMIGRAFL